MVNEIKNSLNGSGLKVAIAVARFNEVVTDKLLEGAVRQLELLGVADKDITVVHVPGAFELPGVCRRLADSGKYSAVMALGAVIRGECFYRRNRKHRCRRQAPRDSWNFNHRHRGPGNEPCRPQGRQPRLQLGIYRRRNGKPLQDHLITSDSIMKVSYRPARVFAMQLLYAMEITGQTAGEALPGVLESQPLHAEQKKYGMKLVDLVQAHREELDENIKAAAAHWELDRMASLDRIVLRIAMVELSYIPEIPMKVAISEAVQIAAKYSTDNSDSFVNGLLTGFMRNRGMVVTEPKEK